MISEIEILLLPLQERLAPDKHPGDLNGSLGRPDGLTQQGLVFQMET